MLLINFSHPITESQKTQIEETIESRIDQIIPVPSQFDPCQPFPEQIRKLINSIKLSTEDWQTLPILINPPSYNFAAVTLLAELHGRMGYFPSIIRIRPASESTPPRYEVAEVINLQNVRDKARQLR